MSSSRSMNQQVPMIVVLVICSTASGAFATENRPLPSGHGVIRKAAGGSEIVITTTPRLAGAIHSLTWGGKEFIDSTDHGRQLQSAANFDVGTRFTAETFNPTEAGSRRDGSGTSSSSRLLHMSATKSALQTTTQMAFWLSPGEKSDGNLAKNKQVLSNHLLTKRVHIGYEDLANVVQYNVTFSVPIGERHNYAQFEAVIQVPDMVKRRGPKEKWGVTEGKARRILNLTDGSEKKPGQWNTMKIECLGRQVKVWVNGDLVNHGSDCTAASGVFLTLSCWICYK
jgi:hypothetical protein